MLPLLVLSSSPIGAQQESPTSQEEGQNTTVSVGSIERQVFAQDGDLVIYLRVQDLEVKVGELVLALQLQDLPELRRLLSGFEDQSGEESESNEGGSESGGEGNSGG